MIVHPQTDITTSADSRGLLLSLFETMVGAADPARLLPPRLPSPPVGRTLVLGAGKAAAAMARAVEDNWPWPLSGLVVTRYGHAIPCERIEVIEAGHPLPDTLGLEAASRMLELCRHLTAEDMVLALFSGGGSALMTLPAPGLSLADLQEVNRRLLCSGAPIAEMNTIRKHLSAIAGGRLAVACRPARVVTFAISDVPGDDPSVIASGPTVPDPSTFADARTAIETRDVHLPPAVRRHFQEAADETPKPGDPTFEHDEVVILATPAQCLGAVAAHAQAAGLRPVI